MTASSTSSTSESNTLAASTTSASNYIPDAATVDRLHKIFTNINKEDVIRALVQCDGDQKAAAKLMLQMSQEVQQQLDIELSENLDISLNSDFDDISSLDSKESLFRAHDYTLDDVLKCTEAESTNTTSMKDYTNTNMDDTISDMVGAFSDFGDFSIDSSSLLSPNELQQCFTLGFAPPVHAASTPPSSTDEQLSKRPAVIVDYGESFLAEPTNTTPMKDCTNTNMDDTISDMVGAFSDFGDFSIDSSSLLSPNELQQCFTLGFAPPVHAASTPPSSSEIIATSSSMITDSDNDGTSSNDDHESITAMLRMHDNNVLLHPPISKESGGTQDLMKAICNCIRILTDKGFLPDVGMEREDTPPSVQCSPADNITNSEQYHSLIEEVWSSIFDSSKLSICPILKLHELIQEASNDDDHDDDHDDDGASNEEEEFDVDDDENRSIDTDVNALFEEKQQHCSFSKFVYGADPSRKYLLLPLITRLLCKHFGYDKNPRLLQMIVSFAMNEQLPKKLCHFYFSENYLSQKLRKTGGVKTRSSQEYITNISILVRASLFIADLINIADIYQMLDILINIFESDEAFSCLNAQSIIKVFAALHFSTSHLIHTTSEAFKNTASNPTTSGSYNVSNCVLGKAVSGPILVELLKCMAMFGLMPRCKPLEDLMEKVPQVKDLLECFSDTSALRQYLYRLSEELGENGNSTEIWEAIQISDVNGRATVLTLPLVQIAFTCYLSRTLLLGKVNGFRYCLRRRLWPTGEKKRVEVESESYSAESLKMVIVEQNPTFRHFELSHDILKKECRLERILAEMCLPHHKIGQIGISSWYELLVNDKAKPFDFNFKCVEHDWCIRAINDLLRKARNSNGGIKSEELCKVVSELNKVLQISKAGEATSSDWAAVAALLLHEK